MGEFFIVAGALSIAWGAWVLSVAKGGIHEVYAAVLIMGGLISAALGTLTVKLDGVMKTGNRLWRRAEEQEKAETEKPATAEPEATRPRPGAFSRRHG
jgi:hypothetical protein